MERNRRQSGLSFMDTAQPIRAFEPSPPIRHTESSAFGVPSDSRRGATGANEENLTHGHEVERVVEAQASEAPNANLGLGSQPTDVFVDWQITPSKQGSREPVGAKS